MLTTRSVRSRWSRNASPCSRAPPWWAYTRRLGANLAASCCQLPTNDIGHSSSVGPTPRSWWR
ncbi:Uncharacterised protein [Mycobacterium tuberculosis]|uniref:Uncharacterized protein n=1 Tax=Mycobacterium tuberculosis TaxID=1773 RepID=A0A916LFK7_MYCTX|nr:Uncharacterised protein [Mycobacterium tuberculosis]COZ47967.1 Uncharacterised protein [Mycobacterium tuberculosis]CPA69982.1 Uncharacterised protein [Mycobacterium tuberculosis]